MVHAQRNGLRYAVFFAAFFWVLFFALVRSALAEGNIQCPDPGQHCKILYLTEQEEKLLMQPNGVLDTAAQARALDLGQFSVYFKTRIAGSAQGEVKPVPSDRPVNAPAPKADKIFRSPPLTPPRKSSSTVLPRSRASHVCEGGVTHHRPQTLRGTPTILESEMPPAPRYHAIHIRKVKKREVSRSFRIPPDVDRMLDAEARKKGWTKSFLIRDILFSWATYNKSRARFE